MNTVYRPDAVFSEGALRSGPLVVSDDGRVLPPSTPAQKEVLLPGRLLLPGFVNGHSHAFQRAIRGRTEFLAAGHERDDFWSWREAMYAAASSLSPEQLHVVSKMAFLEMALAGVTTVAEFHYVHHQADGTPYADEHELAHQVIRAARDVGLRIALLRVGYARAGHQVAPNPRQRRFIDPDVETCLSRTESLARAVKSDALVNVGLAPHSVRAVPKSWLEVVARSWRGPLHMHVAEQPAELTACLAEHGRTPVELLHELGLLNERFTAVHAIHLTPQEVTRLGAARATVCACPSTERNLGDGIVLADALWNAGASVSLGTDSQAHIDLLQEAQMVEGHLRLLRLRRNVLDPGSGTTWGLAARLLGALTDAGSRSAGLAPARLAPGDVADFVTLDLHHPSIVGGPDVLTAGVLGGASSAIREVVVNGNTVVRDGQHPQRERIVSDFRTVMQSVARA